MSTVCPLSTRSLTHPTNPFPSVADQRDGGGGDDDDEVDIDENDIGEGGRPPKNRGPSKSSRLSSPANNVYTMTMTIKSCCYYILLTLSMRYSYFFA